jgi:hypothetical protein
VPNQPADGTVSVSFTLPRILAEAVEKRANIAMTNKSDIIRRALLNYLPENEREWVLKEIQGDIPQKNGPDGPNGPQGPVDYRKRKK